MLEVFNMAYLYIVGHRGAAGLAPENTIASFKKAIECGVDFVELDVRSTRDGFLVVIHDDRVDRTTNGVGHVKDMSLAEIKRLDAGSWFSQDYKGVKIPTLEEALEFLRDKEVGIIVEIKDREIEDMVVRCVENVDVFERVIIASFNFNTLANVRRINDGLPLMAISTSFSADILDKILKLGIRVFALRKDAIDVTVARKCIMRWIPINAWVVNDIHEAKKLLMMGVNIISSDFPNVMCELRNRMANIFWKIRSP